MPNYYKTGFGVTSAIAAIKNICAYVTANTRSVFTENEANYQVPAGKTLIITKISYSFSAANQQVVILYGDTAVQNSAADPTTPIIVLRELAGLAANVEYHHECCIKIPAGKYPHINTTAASCWVKATAILEDAVV